MRISSVLQTKEPAEMQIIESSPDWIVCVKPVGVESEKEMPARLKAQCGGDFFPVHRLDQQVSGLMVYARTALAAAGLNRLVSEGKLEKEYVALCHGTLLPEGRWEDLLWKDPRRNKVYVVDRIRGGVRKAALTFQILGRRGPDVTLVRVRLETGRSHQIRVQFASRGCPLWGDHKYGARDEEKAPLLFSCGLAFPWQEKDFRFELLPPWAENGTERRE